MPARETTMSVAGSFPSDTILFLADLAANNSREWFEANRDRYEAAYVAPGRAFVEALGPRLADISPGVHYEPRVNGSISRINRDVRFSADKSPYKSNLDLWFWHGDKRGWDHPGFYLRITPERVYLGSGMHVFGKEQTERYRAAVLDKRAGAALEKAAAEVAKRGYEVGGRTRKSVPRGLDPAHPRAAFLMHEGLYGGLELPPAEASRAGFADIAFGHFAATWPIGRWLLEEVAGG
jgi:uncharacterized protein (TIGR02453 family)